MHVYIITSMPCIIIDSTTLTHVNQICIHTETISNPQSLICSIHNMQPLTTTKGLLITADNVRHHATFIHSDVTVEKRLIHFSSGTQKEELLRVPLAELGEIKPHSSIRIVVAIKPRASSIDSDPHVGVTDGSNTNMFSLLDPGNFASLAPCLAINAEEDSTRIPTNSQQASVYVLQFDPYHQYGACTTAYVNGYVNTATFNNNLDLTKKLSLVVNRDDAAEEYDFLYFSVEVM